MPRANVALPANGGSAIASSTYTDPAYGYTPGAAINNERKGAPSTSNLWSDAAPSNTFPDWLQINFDGNKTIDEVDVYTLQDNYSSPVEPTEAMTFSLYGLTDYEVQYWNGTSWVTVPGGGVTGNNKVLKKLTFSPITTTKIRVLTNASGDGYSRITEVEAWGNSGATSSADIQWLVSDQLGTPRMIADKTGSLAGIKRHDYLPFGEELVAGTGGRTDQQGYVVDNVRQKFTQKERDSETGLDYFGARYYSSAQGRFMSCDPILLTTKKVVNPQRWNLYIYVLNNPLSLYDPDGRNDEGDGGSNVIDVFIALKGVSPQAVREDINRILKEMGYGTVNPLTQINVYGFEQSTVGNVLKSLRTHGRTTIIVAHSLSTDPNISKQENGGNPSELWSGDHIFLYDGYIGIDGAVYSDGRQDTSFQINAENIFFFGCRLTPRAIASITSRMTSTTASFMYNDGGMDGICSLSTMIGEGEIAAASMASGKTVNRTKNLIQDYVNNINARGGPRRGGRDRIWVKPSFINAIDFNSSKLLDKYSKH